MQLADEYIQWQYEGESDWRNLISLESLSGVTEFTGNFDQGVNLRVSDGYIQWQYKDGNTWNNLIATDTLTGGIGQSAYQLYKNNNPEYTGSEEEWADDLVHGRFGYQKGNNPFNLTFSDATYDYDGSIKSLAVEGTLPENIMVSYINNDQMNPGTYIVTAEFMEITGAPTSIPELVATLTINDTSIDGIDFNDGEFTYDGSAKLLEIEGTLPGDIMVSYVNNGQTDAGTYTVTAQFAYITAGEGAIPDKTAVLTINKADVSGIEFNGKEYSYDGTKKSIAIEGTLPEGVSVSYINNNKTEVGKYPVLAQFINENTNYNNLEDMSATLTINERVAVKLATPTNVTIDEGILTWDAVSNASGYILSMGENKVTVNANTLTYDVSTYNTSVARIQALGSDYYTDSDISNKVNYGMFPQTVVTDNALIAVLDTFVSSTNGYIAYNGNNYAKIIAASNASDYKFNDNTTQVINGNKYYFKVEAISWDILEETDGTYTLLSEYILDSQQYAELRNKYEDSGIRAWLNDDFLNAAFTSNEKTNILDEEVDNSDTSTGFKNNYFVSDNTFDKIYLLSYEEAMSEASGFSASTDSSSSRYRKVTDYALAVGCNKASSYGGTGTWWLRSPHEEGYRYVSCVGSDGNISYADVLNASRGIVPVLKIK